MPQPDSDMLGKALSFFSEPGAVTIEASAEVSADGKPKLPRFNMVAYTGGAMRIAGWRYPVVVDLAGLAIPSQARPIRFSHDPASGVGHSDAIRVEDGKLVAAGVVSRVQSTLPVFLSRQIRRSGSDCTNIRSPTMIGSEAQADPGIAVFHRTLLGADQSRSSGGLASG